MEVKELIENVQNWAREKGIYAYSTALDQKVRMIGELTNEFLDAYSKNKPREEVLTELGDVYVFCINYMTMRGFHTSYIENVFGVTRRPDSNTSMASLIDDALEVLYVYGEEEFLENMLYIVDSLETTVRECLQLAWNKIKDRNTKMINGKAVKEGDL